MRQLRVIGKVVIVRRRHVEEEGAQKKRAEEGGRRREEGDLGGHHGSEVALPHRALIVSRHELIVIHLFTIPIKNL